MIGYKIITNNDGHKHVVLLSPGNHEVLMSSQVYRGEDSAEHLVELLIDNGLQMVAHQSPTPVEENPHEGKEEHGE